MPTQNQKLIEHLNASGNKDGGREFEQEAIASLARGDYALTYEMTKALCNEKAGNKSGTVDEASRRQPEREDKSAAADNQVAACDILTRLSSPSPTLEEKIHTLIALAASRGHLLSELLVSTLVGTFLRVYPKMALCRRQLKGSANTQQHNGWLRAHRFRSILTIGLMRRNQIPTLPKTSKTWPLSASSGHHSGRPLERRRNQTKASLRRWCDWDGMRTPLAQIGLRTIPDHLIGSGCATGVARLGRARSCVIVE